MRQTLLKEHGVASTEEQIRPFRMVSGPSFQCAKRRSSLEPDRATPTRCSPKPRFLGTPLVRVSKQATPGTMAFRCRVGGGSGRRDRLAKWRVKWLTHGNLRVAIRIDRSLAASLSRRVATPHTCFQPASALAASFVMHTVQVRIGHTLS